MCGFISGLWGHDHTGSNLTDILSQRVSPCSLPRFKTYYVPGIRLSSGEQKEDLDGPSSRGFYSLTFCDSIPYASVAEYFWNAVTGFPSSETLPSKGSNWLILSETTVFCYPYYFMDI